MKQKRYQGLLLLMLGSLLFSGCQEAPYQLTENEEALIVSYSSHLVSKYNIYQKDGLVYVADEVEETELPTEAATEVTTEADTESVPLDSENVLDNTGEVTENIEETIKATLTSIYEDTGLTISYEGCQVADSYMDSSAYAARPSTGKGFLILHFNVENQTEEAITFNNFGSGTTYSAKFKMESGTMYHAPSVISLVSNEFSTYEGSIESQNAVKMVLLFEIPQETVEINSLILKIDKNDKVYEINL